VAAPGTHRRLHPRGMRTIPRNRQTFRPDGLGQLRLLRLALPSILGATPAPGHHPWTGPWLGAVDEVKVLDHAAKAHEIRAISGIAEPPAPGPVRLLAPNASLCLGEKYTETSGFMYLTTCVDTIPDLAFKEAFDGAYEIRTLHPLHGPGCMGITNNSTLVGAPVENDFCGPSAATKFRLVPVFGPVEHGHLIQATNSGLCIGTAGNATAAGSQAVQLTCDPQAPGQVFQLDRWPEVPGLPAPGPVRIRSFHSSLCL
jgi:hypothetical protein